ncbi:ribonuclease III [Imleria badia]|nr:ribonuclease III [Imleria badia]
MPFNVLNPTFDDENPFPPLPPIHDDHTRIQVFTHRSFYARPNHVFEDHPDDPSPDNEKFEHLGDTVLGLIVTGLLFDTYPNLRVGPSTKIRALIVGNATLAAISRKYQLPAQLKLHPAQAITLRVSTNVQGKYTLFFTPHATGSHSYVGGLYLDQGLTAVEKWLKLLFKPYTTEAYIRVRTQHGLPPLTPSPSESKTTTCTTSTAAHRNPHHHPHATGTPTTTGHLALFNQQLQKTRREVEWVYDELQSEGTVTTPIWAVRVEVDGETFGCGRGSTKKSARNEAAKEGLVRLGIVV